MAGFFPVQGRPGRVNRSRHSVRHSSSARRGQRGDLVHHRIFLSLFIARGACHSGICAPLPNVDLWSEYPLGSADHHQRHTGLPATLKSHGFVVIRALADAARCAEIRRAARAQLLAKAAPLEYEADLHYPGAPASRRAGGGETVRRLLNAYDRDRVFRCWAAWPSIVDWMQMYFGEPVMLTKAHHNCIMTKHPVYGSLTGWHRDARYWSF